ncbi:MAG: ATP synthase F1 subunit epsilon [Candidatus Cloacimonetes bacterium]|nr:ATP synthase F1 subunit epsilon [Candidatus Cloacimonadota bacterium]
MSLHLKIIQPTRTIIDTECEHVIIPGIAGDFGVSPEHTPFMTKIRPGTLIVYYKDKKINKDVFAIHDGFVTIEKNTVRIVCEVIELYQEIDKNRAEKARKRAEDRMAATDAEIDYRRAELSLKRALARIQSISDH